MKHYSESMFFQEMTSSDLDTLRDMENLEDAKSFAISLLNQSRTNPRKKTRLIYDIMQYTKIDQVIKTMYNVVLAGEKLSAIGSRYAMNMAESDEDQEDSKENSKAKKNKKSSVSNEILINPDLDESQLTVAQRLKRSRTMKRNAAKIAAGRRRSKNRMATPEVINKRAKKAAINAVRKKILSQGKSYDDLSNSEKVSLDKRLQSKKALINKLAKKLLPTIRKRDRNKGTTESTSYSNEIILETKSGNYFSSDMADSTKEKRDAHFQRAKKLPDDDSKAYEPAPGDSMGKTKESKHTKKYRQMYGESDVLKVDKRKSSYRENAKLYNIWSEEKEAEPKGLRKKSEESGVSYSILKDVYDRGYAAWKSGHRPGTTPHQWAMARVNSFLTGGKTTKTADKDLYVKANLNESSYNGELYIPGKNDSLGIPRHEMPNVRKQHRPGLLDHFRKLGLTVKELKVDPKILKPTQNEFNIQNIINTMNNFDPNRGGPIVISSDNRVIDGHHRWLAFYNMNKSIPVYKIGAKVKDVLDAMKSYEHTRYLTIDEIVKQDRLEMLSENSSCDIIGRDKIKDFERLLDRIFAKYKIDFDFTKHFGDRLNDTRNVPCIQYGELALFFNKVYKRQGVNLKNQPNAEVVLKDLQTDLNLPVVIDYIPSRDEFNVVVKTIMRKSNFKTRNKVIQF